jgi:uncharacterized protein
MITPAFNAIATALTRLVVERPVIVAIAALVVLGALASGLDRLEVKTGYRGLFHADDPLLAEIEAINQRYQSGDGLVVVLSARGGDVLDRAGLAAIQRLTDSLREFSEVQRVYSLSTGRRVARTAIGPILVDLVPKTLPRDDTGLEKLRRSILGAPGAAGHLVTAAGDAALVRAEVTLAHQDHAALATFMEKTRGLKRDIEVANPGHSIALGGLVVLNSAFVEAAEGDMRSLFPAMAGLLCLGLWGFTRSWRGVLGPLAVVVAAVLAALGAAGWLALPVTPILSIAPTIILGIGIADSLHILVATDRARLVGIGAEPALYRALRRNLAPIILTTVTTSIGFLCLLFSTSPPFRDLGLVTAIGVAAALFFTLTLLPVVSLAAPGKIRARYDLLEGWIGRAVDLVQDRRGLALAIMLTLVGAAVFGLSKTRSDDQLAEWFDHSVTFRQDLDIIHRAFGTIERSSWVIPLDRGLDDVDADFLAGLDAFSRWLEEQPEVDRTVTLSSVLSDMTGAGSPEAKISALKRLVRVKASRNQLSPLFAKDQDETRILITLTNGSTSALRDLAARARAWLRDKAPPLRHARPAGPVWSLAVLIDSSAKAMLTGTVVAFVVIALCLGLLLRSWRLGWVGLTAMVVPPALVYGLWAWSGRPVGLAESVVAATSLGLLVDASIHILTRYRIRAFQGLEPRVRVTRAFQAAGPALLVGFLILIAGFAILTLSPFRGNMHFGLLTAATLMAGLVVAVLVLPFGLRRETAALEASTRQRINRSR